MNKNVKLIIAKTIKTILEGIFIGIVAFVSILIGEFYLDFILNNFNNPAVHLPVSIVVAMLLMVLFLSLYTYLKNYIQKNEKISEQG